MEQSAVFSFLGGVLFGVSFVRVYIFGDLFFTFVYFLLGLFLLYYSFRRKKLPLDSLSFLVILGFSVAVLLFLTEYISILQNNILLLSRCCSGYPTVFSLP